VDNLWITSKLSTGLAQKLANVALPVDTVDNLWITLKGVIHRLSTAQIALKLEVIHRPYYYYYYIYI